MQSAEIRGLDVFSIVDGNNIGKVRDLIINAASKSVDYLLIDISNWYSGSYVIPFNMAVGIGRDAVMVETVNSLKNINDDPMAVKLVESGIKLIGNRVLTIKGNMIGKISEFYINPDTGQVLGCELVDNDNNVQGIIPADITLTFGKDALVVGDEANDYLLSSIDQYVFPEESAADTQIGKDNTVISKPEAAAIPEPEESNAVPRSKAVDLFEQKQQEYLLGRQIKKDIADDEGNIVIKKESTITREIIDKAMLVGKFKELMMNI
ncbi:MAG: PRC-barrel domain-containing protein [Syntrophomonadaceae bacterium]|jgi:uncharacterized protein YrrD